MRLSILVFSLFMLSLNATAGENLDKALAMEYLITSRFEDVVNASLNEYDGQLFKNAPSEQRADLRKFLQDSMGWDATKDQLADLVINLYTKEEVEASIAFMKSPAGASFTAKNAEFSKRYANFISANLQTVMRDCCSQTK